MRQKIIIIGGVAVGATAATRLRRLSEENEIILFEKGPYISFANCGLPYYIGGTIEKREKLLLQTPEGMKDRFNLDVRVHSEVVAINKTTKTITAKNHKTVTVYEESYDTLILAPGAKPIVPNIPGIADATNLFTLRNVPDTDRIQAFIEAEQPAHAVIIGGGFIGLEMAENLRERGLHVSIVEMQPQLMAMMDMEMAQYIHRELQHHGIDLYLGNGLKALENKGKTIILQDGTSLHADMIILAIGVRPDTKLAELAGLTLGSKGGILVNDKLQTNDPHIYAGGDAVDVTCLVAKKATRVPLAWPANRQARLIADNIMGMNRSYPGTLGTGIIKIFDKVAATTGLSENLLQKHGISNYFSFHIHPNNHAGYYPGAHPVTLKLVAEKETGKILGAQAFGQEGVDKRIDVIATAIKANMTVYDLQELELAYAPPFGSAKDPVNMLGYVGANVLEGVIKIIQWYELETFLAEKGILIDVRTPKEFNAGHVEGAINIPVDNLREQLANFDGQKNYAIICGVGQRAYYANQILHHAGIENVQLVSGGFMLYDVAHHDYTDHHEEAELSMMLQ